jgi:hypothetical protein
MDEFTWHLHFLISQLIRIKPIPAPATPYGPFVHPGVRVHDLILYTNRSWLEDEEPEMRANAAHAVLALITIREIHPGSPQLRVLFPGWAPLAANHPDPRVPILYDELAEQIL